MMNMREKTSLVGEIDRMVATLSLAREQAHEVERAVREMEERLRTARGSSALPEQAAQAVRVVEDAKAKVSAQAPPQEGQQVLPLPPPPPPPKEELSVEAPTKEELSVEARVEIALRKESLTMAQLSRALGEPVNKINEVLRKLRAEHKVYNLGSADYPTWTFRIGDQTTTPELAQAVRRLVTERPLTLRELVDATGARMSRVSGVMVQLQRVEKQLVNLGSPRLARWFLLSSKVQSATISPKRRKK